MATRRPDLYLLALLALHGVVPDKVAEAVIALYDQPPPVNYETAMERVHNTIGELIESGVFDLGVDDDDDNDKVLDKRLPVAVRPNHRQLSAVTNNESHRSLYDPPFWMVACYEKWDEIRNWEGDESGG